MATALLLGTMACIILHTLLLIVLIATPTFGDLIDLLEEPEDSYAASGKCFRSLVFVVSDTLPSCHCWPATEIVRCCEENCRTKSLITKGSQ